MTDFDVFNGDADGICALHQLRLADPLDSVLITGVKRDISLVRHVKASADDRVTVLDISFDKNREAVLDVLAQQAHLRYFDHHFAGDIPDHDLLQTHINTDAETCTGLIVNNHLDGAFLPWAVTAAFGDNLDTAAVKAAEPLGLDTEQMQQLKTLGTLLNYNGYGSAIEDLYYPPANLYRRLVPYENPLDFVANDEAFQVLQNGFHSDRDRVQSIKPHEQTDTIALYLLPDDPFARRISGVYANELAVANPGRAHALLSTLADGAYLVSVRAPLNNRTGADELCRQFDTGGGRKAAAGINHLPANELERFSKAMQAQFGA